MSILGFFNKHGKIEQYERKSEPMGDIIPFPKKEKKGLEELKFIDITHTAKKRAHGLQTGNAPLLNNPITG